MNKKAFLRLHPSVQRLIHCFDTKGDIVVSAPTAKGKTEALVLPVLSAITMAPKPSIQSLSVAPLKALINKLD
jgi:Lhr-like helicase